jgi:hypothetical protein
MIKAGKLEPIAVVAEQRVPAIPTCRTLARGRRSSRRHAALAEHVRRRRRRSR